MRPLEVTPDANALIGWTKEPVIIHHPHTVNRKNSRGYGKVAFQTPITIRKALDHIQKRDYVLPAIQREVVWRPDQIERLFDSLMQGYPIGSFLLWKIDSGHSKEFVFYEFMTHYHQRDHSHLDRLNDLVEARPITGVLDGQQRLTALNIGLRGSHAEKLPRLWVTNPHAFPVKRLYLQLDGTAPENELGMEYDFKFLGKQNFPTERDGANTGFVLARFWI